MAILAFLPSHQICAGALFGVVWAFIWSREASFRLERWLHDAFAYGGASSPQILALCLVAAAVLVTGPVERLWKGAFKTAKANEHKEKPVS
jgi:Mg/Co/Ni transporter MgtE